MHYSLRRATTWNLAGYLYLIIASLVSTPLLVRYLGITDFALYGLITATVILVSSLDFGLPQAVVRALSAQHKSYVKRQQIWATSSVLFITTGVVAGLVAVGISNQLHISLVMLLLIFTQALLNNVVGHYLTLPHAEGHFGYYNTKTFVVGTANTFLAAFLAWKGQGITGILLGQLVSYFVSLLILAYFSLKYFPHPRDGVVSLSVAKSLLSFGFKNQVGKLIGQIQAQYGKYLLVSLSPLSLSSYVISTGLVQKMAGGVTQVATALYPASARGGDMRKLRRVYYQLQLGLLFVTLLGIGAYYLYGHAFLLWWLKSAELASMSDAIFKYLVWYFAALILCPLATTVLDSRGKPEVTSFFAFLTTLIEILLALALFSRYGLFAPVYASVIAIFITTPFLLYTTDRIIKVKS
jgi:O-antigen/teichoic acid export membrane protein